MACYSLYYLLFHEKLVGRDALDNIPTDALDGYVIEAKDGNEAIERASKKIEQTWHNFERSKSPLLFIPYSLVGPDKRILVSRYPLPETIREKLAFPKKNEAPLLCYRLYFILLSEERIVKIARGGVLSPKECDNYWIWAENSTEAIAEAHRKIEWAKRLFENRENRCLFVPLDLVNDGRGIVKYPPPESLREKIKLFHATVAGYA